MGVGKDGEAYEGKAQSSICGQPRKDNPAAKPCGAEKSAHTARQIHGLRGRTDIQSGKRPCKENEN